MTNIDDYKLVKDVEILAKRSGFRVKARACYMVLETMTKGWPAVMCGPNEELFSTQSVEELRGYLIGWNHFLGSMRDVEFDEAEYKKRAADIKVMDRLKKK